MRPLPSSRACIGYGERKGVLLCLEVVILSMADTAAAEVVAAMKTTKAVVQHFA